MSNSSQPSTAELDLRPLRERLADVELGQEADFEQANERLYRAGLTDGLPVIPPTAAHVAAMLAGCDANRPATREPLMPSWVVPTLWEVAVCAVMAGALPAYLPVIVAALRALTEPAFNLLGIQTTTGAATPLLIVHGSLATQLDINAGTNCLGQGRRANATIGRAVKLVLQNVGLALPGSGDMATHGQPGKFSWCCAENDTASPWPPLHSTRGLTAASSAVTVVGAVGSVEVVLGGTPEEDLATLAGSTTFAGNLGAQGTFGSGQSLILLPPECARSFAAQGWDRAELQHRLFALARVPYAALGARGGRVRRLHEELHLDGEGGVPAVRSPQDFLIAVTGGIGTKATVVPTWGGGSEAITQLIEPL